MKRKNKDFEYKLTDKMNHLIFMAWFISGLLCLILYKLTSDKFWGYATIIVLVIEVINFISNRIFEGWFNNA